MRNTISNSDDVIDSRDVIARIEELESELKSSPDTFEDQYELTALKSLADEAEKYAPDWHYGETLIRDSYFRTHAQELADRCGLVQSGASWPNNCIDWEEAADQLKQDYTSVDFDGVEYWIR